MTTTNNSLVSKTAELIDVPEAKNYQVKFLYFGYDIEEAIAKKGDAQQIQVLYTQVEDTVEFGDIGLVRTLILEDNTLAVDALSSGEILDESVGVDNFTNILLQDHYVEERSADLLTQAGNSLNVDLENLAPVDGASAIISVVSETGEGLVSTVGSGISDEILSAILQQKDLNESLLPADMQEGETIVGQLAGIQHMNFVDSRVAKDVCSACIKNPFGPFSENLSYSLDTLDPIQSTARDNDGEYGTISTNFWEYGVTPIAATSFVSELPKLGEAIVVGYLVEKTEIISDSESGETVTFFLVQEEGVSAGESSAFIDEDIKIATTYSYSIATVAVCRIPGALWSVDSVDGETIDELANVDVIVKSRVQTSVITTGVGYPPPPTDVTFTYDPNSKNMLIQWGFGFDDLNTVKFQVFRRNNIMQPFSLLRQYDFDTSEVPANEMEDVDFGLNVILDEPLFYYIDEKFVEGKEYIYALCSINSDGASSPYSEQFSVYYNSSEANLVVKQVSSSHAPKPYPNMYLERDITTSIGKVSNISKLDLYFTPEVLNVLSVEYDPIETDVVLETTVLDFLKESGAIRDTGKYQIELTELGVFQNELIEVKLASDDFEIRDTITNELTGEIDSGLILDPTLV